MPPPQLAPPAVQQQERQHIHFMPHVHYIRCLLQQHNQGDQENRPGYIAGCWLIQLHVGGRRLHCGLVRAASAVLSQHRLPPLFGVFFPACLPCVLQLHEVLLPTGVQVVSLSASKPFTAVVSLHSGSPVVVELSDTPVLTTLDTSIDLKGIGGP